MTKLMPIADLDAFVTTRNSWHSLAEHVLTKARHSHTERIGLRPHAGGFATPHFGDDRRVFVDASGIHLEQFGDVASVPFTTLSAAAAFIGIEAGAPVDVFAPSTPCDLDARLTVDDQSMHILGDWFAFGGEALRQLRAAHADDNPSLVQLWPEHFDLAVDFGDVNDRTRANYGASPGDGAIPKPYLYVGPWEMTDKTDDPFWNQPWGTALAYDALCAAPDPLGAAASFFAHAATRL